MLCCTMKYFNVIFCYLQKYCYFSFLLLDMYVTYMIMKSDKLLNTIGYIIIKYCIFFYLILKLQHLELKYYHSPLIIIWT